MSVNVKDKTDRHACISLYSATSTTKTHFKLSIANCLMRHSSSQYTIQQNTFHNNWYRPKTNANELPFTLLKKHNGLRTIAHSHRILMY